MNDFSQYDALREALINYYGNGKIGSIADHLPVGAEMVDSRYIRYQGQTERLDQWCRMLDVYNAPKSYNVKGNYQSRTSSSGIKSAREFPKHSHRPFASCSDEELVAIAQKTSDRFNKAIEEAIKIGQEYGINVTVSENNILNLVFSKLKERRDTVTKEAVEFDYKKALKQLADQGNYAMMQQLIALFREEKYKEVSNILQTI